VYLTRDPFEIMPGLQTTGEVPRETAFEEPGLSLSTIKEGRVVDDLIMDDISVVARVRDKGLVALTGCSHAGIVNITRHALNLTGEKKVEGILGGLHLVGATADRIHKTVDALAQLGPGWIAAGHCTGFGAQAALSAAFGDRFSPLCCGFRLAV
jgi:7,8-dihydropterin-6-yl-methyl-4-(beta-D-ribofuranosyl)aminobenzene 5'-phosphate synthase